MGDCGRSFVLAVKRWVGVRSAEGTRPGSMGDSMSAGGEERGRVSRKVSIRGLNGLLSGRR